MTGLFRGFLAVLLLIPLAVLTPAAVSMLAPEKRQSTQGADTVRKPVGAADERAASIAAYEQALREAAVRRPNHMQPLRTLDPNGANVEVTYFGFATLAGDKPLDRVLWVALSDQLKSECRGKPQPRRALQQILGLPPVEGKQKLYLLSVSPKDMRRPCLSGAGVQSENCSFKFPERVDDHLIHIAVHNWTALRTGFRNEKAGHLDYPFDGFPFTGMGWTYNWDPAHPTNVGVTEFVLPMGTTIQVKGMVEPEQFCAAAVP